MLYRLREQRLNMKTFISAWCLFLVGKQLIKEVNEEINQVISDHKFHEEITGDLARE